MTAKLGLLIPRIDLAMPFYNLSLKTINTEVIQESNNNNCAYCPTGLHVCYFFSQLIELIYTLLYLYVYIMRITRTYFSHSARM